ncbi:UNVERIFIED_CONTAM: hypothetical protein GTU68_044287 [Idotea baltica]|nr:hypothetical protein [Idotea baltica]
MCSSLSKIALIQSSMVKIHSRVLNTCLAMLMKS